jgi:hypothetical protein
MNDQENLDLKHLAELAHRAVLMKLSNLVKTQAAKYEREYQKEPKKLNKLFAYFKALPEDPKAAIRAGAILGIFEGIENDLKANGIDDEEIFTLLQDKD